MEMMSYLFFIIIVVYMVYGFLRNRAGKKASAHAIGEEGEKQSVVVEETEIKGTELAALAAVLAAIMGDTAHVIKRVYAIPAVDGSNSSWRFAGRNEMMTGKNTLK